jgi:hypothetical protein
MILILEFLELSMRGLLLGLLLFKIYSIDIHCILYKLYKIVIDIEITLTLLY